MKRLIVATIAAGALGLAVAGTAFAEPTVDQIYTAVNGGHLDQAQTMITEVLAAHPDSARAHYIQAELYARESNYSQARSELGTAERLKPGLPFANPRSVQELQAQLGLRNAGAGAAPMMVRQAPAQAHFPWVAVLVVVGAIALLLMLFRRRTYAQPYPVPGQGPAGGPYGPGGAPYGGYGPGYGPAPMGGGGIGSGIAGGLASGLAVGAGVVAGEEIAHHFLDGGHSTGGVIPPAEAGERSNNDMGGNDFGVNDPGAGWDDGGGGFDGGGGGGGDWS